MAAVPDSSLPNESFFAILDAPFRNIDRANEPIVYQTKDCLVQWHFELPIPTQPGSLVRYTFLTTIGDISFAAKFVDKEGGPPETLIDACRVPSDVEPIMGSFRSRRAGTLYLVFDNSFSWLQPKLLTYRVVLLSPSVGSVDEARSLTCRALLADAAEQGGRERLRLNDAEQAFANTERDVDLIEGEIARLEDRLSVLKVSRLRQLEEVSEGRARVAGWGARRAGLLLRTLTAPSLARVLAFLGGSKSPAAGVCKYWLSCAKRADALLSGEGEKEVEKEEELQRGREQQTQESQESEEEEDEEDDESDN